MEGRVRSRRGGRRDRMAGESRTRRRTDARVAHRLYGACRPAGARRRNRNRSVDEPQLPRCTHPRRVAQGLARIPLRGTLVLTSEDGVLAGGAAPEARALTTLPVRYLAAGNAEWCQAGYALSSDGARMADEPVDLWLKPYEQQGDTKPS